MMSLGVGARRRLRPNRWRKIALLVTVTGIALLTAACSGNPAGRSPGAAPAVTRSASPPPGPGSSPAAGRQVTKQRQLAYSVCMRKHGVPGVPTTLPSAAPDGTPPTSPHWNAAKSGGPNPGSPRWLAAQHACRSLQPRPAAMASG
jgi:hypothetical protein